MIKTLKRKFVFTAMLAITVFILLLLGAINLFFAVSNGRQTDMLLESLIEQRLQNDLPPVMTPFPEDKAEERPGFFVPRPNEEERHSAVHFFAVLDKIGGVISVDVSRTATVDTDEAREMARKAYGEEDTRGRIDGWKYAAEETEEGTLLYLFLSTDGARSATLRVLGISALIGALGWLLMLLLVLLLSGRAIRPIAENMEKQRRFVTDAGHEIKTPLAIIVANTDAMVLHTGETKWSRNIRTQADRLSGLMQDLLTLARSDEGGEVLKKEKVDLVALLKDVEAMFSEGMLLKRIAFTERLPASAAADANPTALFRLFSLLFDNAVKYTPEGGEIALALTEEGHKLRLTLENDTDGLPCDDPERLFDRFYRADEARSRETGGSGIGLSAARAIAEAHGFTLTCEYPKERRIRFTLTM